MVVPPSRNLPRLDNLTIVVVDDNDDSLDVISTFLRVCGANVLMARNAASGLAYLDTSSTVHAVVTDLAMPDMDGMEFARRLRRHPRRGAVPLIAVTAFYERYPNSPEFDAWLTKPIDLTVLGVLIESLARRPEPKS